MLGWDFRKVQPEIVVIVMVSWRMMVRVQYIMTALKQQ